jgi:hypothetical protein
VFVETYDLGPVATPFAMFEVEMTVKGVVEPTRRAAEVTTNMREVDVAFACAEGGAAVSLGVLETLADALQRFGERLPRRTSGLSAIDTDVLGESTEDSCELEGRNDGSDRARRSSSHAARRRRWHRGDPR